MTIHIDYLAVSLLDNLRCDSETIQLSPELSIVRLDKLTDPKARYIFGEEAINFSNKIANDTFTPNTYQLIPFEIGVGNIIQRPAQLSNYTLYWRFVGDVPEPVSKNFDTHAAANSFRNTLTALRLVKPEFVGRYPTRIIGDPNVSTVPGGFVISAPLEDPEYLSFPNYKDEPSQAYVVEANNINTLRQTLKALMGLSNVSIQVAISRFNGQYTRHREEDRLIDAVVALEALYLSGVNDELKFRLAVRAASHIGNDNKAERERIFELVTKAYDLRSTIVHGSLHDLRDAKVFKQGFWKRPNELLNDLTAVLRSSLKSILIDIGAGRFRSQFHKELDKSIIEGTTFQK